MQNEIVKNSVVTLKYTVRDPEGAVIDDGEHPLVYLHGGYDGIFPLLEEALHGKKVGEQLQVKLQPEDAFGDYDEELILVEDAKLFPDNIEIGMSFERVSEDGEEDMIYRITDIADGKVVVDGNHPLAGVALVFDVTVARCARRAPRRSPTAMCMVPVVITTTDCTDVRTGPRKRPFRHVDGTCGCAVRVRGRPPRPRLVRLSPPSSASICCGPARVVPRA